MATLLGGDLEHPTQLVKEIPLTGTTLPGKGRSRSQISGPLELLSESFVTVMQQKVHLAIEKKGLTQRNDKKY